MPRFNEDGPDRKASPRPFLLLAHFALDFARFARWRGALSAAAVITSAALEAAGLVLLVPLLAVAIGATPNGSRLTELLGRIFAWLNLTSRLQQLIFLFAAFAALMILRLIAASLRDVTLTELQITFVDARRTAVVRGLAGARWDAVARLRQARVAQLVSADVQRIGLATRLLQLSVVSVVMLSAQSVAALVLSPILALFCFLLLAVGGTALSAMLHRAHVLGEKITGTNLTVMNTIVQFFGGLKLAMSQDLQNSYVGEMEDALQNLAARQMEFARYQAGRQLAFGIMAALVGAAISSIGLGLLHIAPAVVVALLLILVRMSGPAAEIQQSAQQLLQCLPAYESIRELEDQLVAAAAHVEESQIAAMEFINDDIEFREVGFSYSAAPSDKTTLTGISVVIPHGTFLGVSGHSGAGKTTFADLLVGLFQPDHGEVCAGGVALRGTALAAWRKKVSYVSQDPYLFYDSVRQNLLWANPLADEGLLWQALATAGAETLVRQMPDGLDTTVGERGTLMSGGERQRLALARALVRNPSLLVLDEATNAIDIAGERKLIENLLRLTPRPTIVMIAHRRESLELCERILGLEDGKLVSDGTGAAFASA